MDIRSILLLPQIEDKLADKHGVDGVEVEEVFAHRPLYLYIQRGNQTGENVYSALGKTFSGRYLIVYFIWKKSKDALVLSARDMAPKERRAYDRR